jgi:hypothetical protein
LSVTKFLAESSRTLLLQEAEYPSVYYIPKEDADMSLLVRTAHHTYCPYKGDCTYYSIPAGGSKTRSGRMNALMTQWPRSKIISPSIQREWTRSPSFKLWLSREACLSQPRLRSQAPCGRQAGRRGVAREGAFLPPPSWLLRAHMDAFLWASTKADSG